MVLDHPNYWSVFLCAGIVKTGWNEDGLMEYEDFHDGDRLAVDLRHGPFA
jgi:hypothetical protein